MDWWLAVLGLGMILASMLGLLLVGLLTEVGTALERMHEDGVDGEMLTDPTERTGWHP